MTFNLCAVLRCTEQPYIQHPLLLCRRHALMVSINVTDVLHANALDGQPTSTVDVDRAAVSSDDAWDQPSHQPLVYFAVNGDRVKIGTSTNITARMAALCLRRSNAAILLDGGPDLENALHKHFESDRVQRTEWFILSKRIRSYIADRKAAAAALRQPTLAPEETTHPTDRSHLIPQQPAQPTASDRILSVLQEHADPAGIDIAYMDRPALHAATGLVDSTFANTLKKLEAAGKLHRISEGKTVRVGLGPQPR